MQPEAELHATGSLSLLVPGHPFLAVLWLTEAAVKSCVMQGTLPLRAATSVLSNIRPARRSGKASSSQAYSVVQNGKQPWGAAPRQSCQHASAAVFSLSTCCTASMHTTWALTHCGIWLPGWGEAICTSTEPRLACCLVHSATDGLAAARKLNVLAAPQRQLAAIEGRLAAQQQALSRMARLVHEAGSVAQQVLAATAAVSEKLSSLAACAKESGKMGLKQQRAQENMQAKLNGIISCLSHRLVHPERQIAHACGAGQRSDRQVGCTDAIAEHVMRGMVASKAA